MQFSHHVKKLQNCHNNAISLLVIAYNKLLVTIYCTNTKYYCKLKGGHITMIHDILTIGLKTLDEHKF